MGPTTRNDTNALQCILIHYGLKKMNTIHNYHKYLSALININR